MTSINAKPAGGQSLLLSQTDQQAAIFLAQDATRILGDEAQEASKEPGIKAFCSSLAAALRNAHQYLKDLESRPFGHIDSRKVLNLLQNLDRLCQWPSSSRTSEQYAQLSNMIKRKVIVRKAIKGFARDTSAKQHRMKLLQLLETIATLKKPDRGPELSDISVTNEVQRNQHDYQVYIRGLYSSLVSTCMCRQGTDNTEITTNLRLRDCYSPNIDGGDSIAFRLFFLDHPHVQDDEGCSQWQDTCIRVSKRREVRFKPPSIPPERPSLQSPISVDEFCRLITNRQQAQLNLAVSRDGLVRNGPGQLSQGFHLDASSVSLSRLLRETELSRKMKLLVSYFLAKAVWQFYDSKWMQKEWTKDDLHFMFEKRSPVPRAIFINEPFLSSSFGGSGRLCCTEDDDFRSHPFPKILALGIMFLEIELGIRIEDYRLPVCIDMDGNPNVNADHIAAMEVFNTPDLWEKTETFGAFRTVIEVCLTPEPFIPSAGNSDDVRHILEERVVHPLQKLYLTAWGDPETSTIRHIELDKSALTDQTPMRQPSAAALHPQSLASAIKNGDKRDTTPQPHGQLVAQWPQATTFGPEELRLIVPRLQAPKSSSNYRHNSSSSPYSISQDFPHGGTMSTKQAASSEIWFDELDRLTSLLRGKSGEKDESSAAAKIAILDTGVSEDAESPALKNYKDFTKLDDVDDTWQDSTGHGTEAMRLILKVYSMAEIYVGRVFRSRQADTDTASLMAKAIYHATDEWKVDIIIVPSGFKSHHQRIAEAIDHAIHARVLLFCAASNYGNLTEIAFPGRLYTHGKTLCMFSTDANVRCSPRFNPSPLSSARYSFAVLGENIALAPYNMHPDKTLSGTSYATMIGGALAGRILDFSRHKDTRDKIRHAEYLKTVEGISAIFAKMAKGGIDNGFHCIAPWKILPPEKDDDDETDTGLKRKDERKYVCETISRALEDIHST